MKTGVHRPAHEDYTKYSKLCLLFQTCDSKQNTVKGALAECTNAIQTDRVMVKEF